MPESTRWTACTAQLPNGSFCDRDSAPDAPFPICVKHIARVVEFVYDAQCSPTNAIEVENRERHAEQYLREDRGVVYYVRVGELIKIGTTTQALHSRLSGLPPGKQILAIEPGGHGLERTRHLQFRHLRAQIGEWFRPDPGLWQHIAELRDQHGVPDELTSRSSMAI